MASVPELRADVEELKQMVEGSQRSRVKDLLINEIRRLEADIHRRAAETEAPKPTATPAQSGGGVATQQQQRTKTKIDLYAWGQSEKFLNLYISDKLKNLKSLPAENVVATFTERSVHLEVVNLDGRDFYFDITNLSYPIAAEESNHKINADRIVLNLKKKTAKEWECVTAAEKAMKDKKKEKEKPDLGADGKGDPSAGLMNMMKKMYEEGDDDMKRTLTKAWYESSQKQQKGLDPMAGMGGLGME